MEQTQENFFLEFTVSYSGGFKKRVDIIASTLSFKSPVIEGGSVVILGDTTDCYQGGLQKKAEGQHYLVLISASLKYNKT